MNTDGKLEWFGGNQDALNMYRALVHISHTWDDLVDKDKEVSADAINLTFFSCLVGLPSNPFYRSIQDQILPMWMAIISAYETANKYEQDKDAHGIEIAHNLRYAVGHIICVAVTACVGVDKARETMPEVWKHIVRERFDDYRKEHLSEAVSE